jgi:hypothetical protein
MRRPPASTRPIRTDTRHDDEGDAMTLDPERRDQCRRLISSVLDGVVTPAIDPAVFSEDILYFAVCALEEDDAEWLLAAARDRRHPLAGRKNLVMSLGRYQAALWAELCAEDPTLPEYPFAH